ncbi:hypothetical protein PUR61_10285 [Streptomyces sp. BE20]|uniref:hypothetical protein n=1 Tax=unclassified Streptomyces TaxID=2593676 RepID=UPI002E79BF7A|nr:MULTISPECIES: hypothetical protein [unclassified Streptomyces]MED7949757.1 hypothetical protein [Streptomyces sp. BE303]MEE1822575.1 hypothetical protein [Streptomyces sp. BE20]
MTEINQSQSSREAAEIALWATPSPSPDVSTIPELVTLGAASNDQEVGNKAVGDGSALPDLGPLSSFDSWETVACTIWNKVDELSGFNPKSTDFDPIAWSGFLEKLSTTPLLLGFSSTNRTASISPLSLEKAVETVSDLIKNIMTPANFEDVVTTIKKVAHLAVQNPGKPTKDSNMQVGILSHHAGKLYLAVIRTTVEMEYKKEKKGYEPLAQTFSVYRGYGELDFEKCKRSAGTLLEWNRQDVKDWEGGAAVFPVPPNGSPAWGK